MSCTLQVARRFLFVRLTLLTCLQRGIQLFVCLFKECNRLNTPTLGILQLRTDFPEFVFDRCEFTRERSLRLSFAQSRTFQFVYETPLICQALAHIAFGSRSESEFNLDRFARRFSGYPLGRSGITFSCGSCGRFVCLIAFFGCSALAAGCTVQSLRGDIDVAL